jgi:hypothetical protein
MKTRPDALGNAENESENEKTRKRVPTLSVTSKMSPGVQNMKIGTDALGTVEN